MEKHLNEFENFYESINVDTENLYRSSCVTHDNVLLASNEVNILSFGMNASRGRSEHFQKRWTIVPKHKGASVSRYI